MTHFYIFKREKEEKLFIKKKKESSRLFDPFGLHVMCTLTAVEI
jgi:hypothetical protein